MIAQRGGARRVCHASHFTRLPATSLRIALDAPRQRLACQLPHRLLLRCFTVLRAAGALSQTKSCQDDDLQENRLTAACLAPENYSPGWSPSTAG